jgi:hypothetical protein
MQHRIGDFDAPTLSAGLQTEASINERTQAVLVRCFGCAFSCVAFAFTCSTFPSILVMRASISTPDVAMRNWFAGAAPAMPR